MSSEKELSVRLAGQPVGVLSQDPQGKMNFVYLPAAHQVLSLSLPLTDASYGHERCEAYFGGLLPESESARKAIGLRFGINPKNTFSLLKAIGHDCAGAVSLHAPDAPITEREPLSLKGRVLTDAELATHIRELPRKPLFIGVEGLRLSLAGAQDKAAVCLLDNQVALPEDFNPTTYILKPAIDLLDGTVQNEVLCLRLAARLGLNVPEVQIRQVEDLSYLLVQRYDREILSDGRLRRIHQEDFCQALSVASAYKYQREGGPGFKECFDLLKRTSRPALDRTQLAETMVFNFLVGNMDAHGKNFSLLHKTAGLTRMAPLYDVLCTRVYEGLTDRMAMKVGSEYEVSRVFSRHWEAMCKEMGFSYPALKKIFRKQLELLLPAAEAEAALLRNTGFEAPVLGRMLAFFRRNAERVEKMLTGSSS